MHWPHPFRPSPSTERAMNLPRPRWRGVSHLVAAIVSVPVGIWAVLVVPDGAATTSVAVFAGCISAMFTVSAVVHARRWPPHVTELLVRADHTTIYLAIAGTGTPVAMLGLTGWPHLVLLWGAWGAALLGIVVEWLPFPTPKGVANTIYLTMGWATVPFVPLLARESGWLAVALLLAGGALYTVGAIVVGARRPDPRPHVFGYHEIWHLFVIGAVAVHYVLVVGVLAAA